ncbi:AbiV family abortive infection protein [Streptomyces rubrogriseus]
MNPVQAHEFWKALMDNASSLITDAHTLLSVESYGRARSLTVLAQEELGKALWVYVAFQTAWSQGDTSPRVVDALTRHGRSHTKKYLEAVVFGDELAEFWGDYSTLPDMESTYEEWVRAIKKRHAEAETAASEANLAKQRGFYVDRDANGNVVPNGASGRDHG